MSSAYHWIEKIPENVKARAVDSNPSYGKGKTSEKSNKVN